MHLWLIHIIENTNSSLFLSSNSMYIPQFVCPQINAHFGLLFDDYK